MLRLPLCIGKDIHPKKLLSCGYDILDKATEKAAQKGVALLHSLETKAQARLPASAGELRGDASAPPPPSHNQISQHSQTHPSSFPRSAKSQPAASTRTLRPSLHVRGHLCLPLLALLLPGGSRDKPRQRRSPPAGGAPASSAARELPGAPAAGVWQQISAAAGSNPGRCGGNRGRAPAPPAGPALLRSLPLKALTFDVITAN